MLELDYNKAQQFQLTNDAFFYLYAGEMPLDDANLDEAFEIQNMFPDGFYIEDTWTAIDDTDLIEAVFIPLIDSEELFDYDEYLELSNNVHIQIKWLDKSHVKVWWANVYDGTRKPFRLGKYEVKKNNKGHLYFGDGDIRAGKGCMFYLKRFKKKGS